MNSSSTPRPVVLVPGHWLGAWAWGTVADHLRSAGHEVVALTLPGLDPEDAERLDRTLEDQAAALETALVAICTGDAGGRGEPGTVVLVAHSGANAPVGLVLDRRPDLVGHVVWVDSGPVASGVVWAPDLPEAVRELPLPPWDDLAQQASIEGLDEEALAEFRRRAVTQPAAVVRGTVELGGDVGLRVPATLVCCSLDAETVQSLAASGHPMFAEVARCADVSFVDLPTGHWPMWSRAEALAQVIAAAGV